MLAEHHRALLDASAISQEVAERRGYRTSATKADLRRLGFGASQALHPALVIPLWTVSGEVGGYQLRADNPRPDDKGRAIKYETPTKMPMLLDVHPDARSLMADPRVPLVVTEGVRKADSCYSNLDVPAIALMGVFGWRGRNTFDGLAALADWEDVPLNREVLVVFDSDLTTKAPVLEACGRLGAFLARRHAEVSYVRLPDGDHGAKCGLDDFLAGGGRLADLRELAVAELPRSKVTAQEPEDDYSDLVPETGAGLLDAITAFYRRFLVLGSEDVAHALSLWALHTWAISSFTISPRLYITSPVPRAGKSRVIEVAYCLVRRPEIAILPSASAVYRLTEATRPAWLLDEFDNLLAASEEARAALTAVINAGYRAGATVPRVEKGKEGRWEVNRFRIFSAVALAGIGGGLPDTTADRSVVIHMERKLITERLDRFHIERTFAAAATLRRRAAAWAKRHGETLASAEPVVPEELDDRAVECWEPLAAVAAVAGGEWPARAREAAIALSGPDRDKGGSPGIQLLADLRDLWKERVWGERVATRTIVTALCQEEESDWRHYRGGFPIDGAGLARLLAGFGIHSDRQRIGGRSLHGYFRKDLEPVWARYLPASSPLEQTEQTEQSRSAPTRDVPDVPSVPANPEQDHDARTPPEDDPLSWDADGRVRL